MGVMSESAIKCQGVIKRFGGTVAVNTLDLEVGKGQVLALLGPSGCGKTTLLRMLAGFETPDGGMITVRERVVCAPGVWVPPEKRQIGFVFQDYALFPHLSVGSNVAFGLGKMARAERRKRAAEMLELVGLIEHSNKMPHELSGGQQQRVALARALAPDPDVVLLDEPFSNLDADLRRSVRDELRRILDSARATAVFVTHDQEEALNLGTRVAVMNRGRIVETGTPREIYLNPKSKETAQIVGSVNMLKGESMGVTVRCALGQLPLAHPCRFGPMEILMRPEGIRLRPFSPYNSDPREAAATVQDLQYHGNHQHIRIRLDSGEDLRVKVGPEQFYQVGQKVSVKVPDPVVAFERAENGKP